VEQYRRTILAVVLAFTLLGVQAMCQVATGQGTIVPLPGAEVGLEQAAVESASITQVPRESLVGASPSFGGTPLACSQPQKLMIPRSVAKRAKLKAELLNALRESIFDDAKGIVNLTRERQIKELVSKLTREREE
jgi:hypothetical protein